MIVTTSSVDFKAEDAKYSVFQVAQWLYPSAKERPKSDGNGAEIDLLCPHRADNHLGSFRINTITRMWSDYGGSPSPNFQQKNSGNDLISLVAYFLDLKPLEALRAMQQALGPGNPDGNRSELVETRTVIMPVPGDAARPPHSFEHKSLGRPDHVHPYRDRAGDLLCFVCRWDVSRDRQRKIFQPLSYCKSPSGTYSWLWTAPASKPLYGLDSLRGASRLIIVEGELKCDKARTICPSDDWLGWMGGADSVKKIDITPIAQTQAEILLWPDHSEKGIQAMERLAQRLKAELSIDADILRYPDGFHGAKDWDVGDAIDDGWSAADIRQFIEDNTGARTPSHFLPIEGYHIIDDWPLTKEVQRGPAKDGNAKLVTVKIHCIENFKHMLDKHGIVIRHNEMTREEDILMPGSWGSNNRKHHRNSRAAMEIRNLCAKHSITKTDVHENILAVAMDNPWCPFVNFVNECKPHANPDAFESLVDTIKAKQSREFIRMGVLRFLVSMCAVTFKQREGIDGGDARAQFAFIFTGAEGLGKTSWFSRLLPPGMSKTGVSIDPSNRDLVDRATKAVLVELGEIDQTFDRAHAGALKAWLLQDEDSYRKAFHRDVVAFPRRTVFCGTVNDQEFLADGDNRRWFTIHPTWLDYQTPRDLAGIWGYVYQRYIAGEPWWLNNDERTAVIAENKSYVKYDSMYEQIVSRMDWDSQQREAMIATAVADALGLDASRQKERNAVSRALRRLVNEKSIYVERRGKLDHYIVPPILGVELAEPRRPVLLPLQHWKKRIASDAT